MKIQTLILFTYKDNGLYGEVKVNAKCKALADKALLDFISETNRCIDCPSLIEPTYKSFKLVSETPEVISSVITEN